MLSMYARRPASTAAASAREPVLPNGAAAFRSNCAIVILVLSLPEITGGARPPANRRNMEANRSRTRAAAPEQCHEHPRAAPERPRRGLTIPEMRGAARQRTGRSRQFDRNGQRPVQTLAGGQDRRPGPRREIPTMHNDPVDNMKARVRCPECRNTFRARIHRLVFAEPVTCPVCRTELRFRVSHHSDSEDVAALHPVRRAAHPPSALLREPLTGRVPHRNRRRSSAGSPRPCRISLSS